MTLALISLAVTPVSLSDPPGLRAPRAVAPAAVRCDNWSELLCEVFVSWCEENGIEIRYIQPGKPNQNAFIERFNRTYRNEVLNA